MATIGQDLQTILGEVVAEVKTLELDALTIVQSVVAAVKQGQFAAPLTAIATLLHEAAAVEAALAKDVNALVPTNVKAFIGQTGTLNSEIAIPIANKTLVSSHYLASASGDAALAEFVAKVAAGMPL